MKLKKIIIGITGATGAIYGIKLIEELKLANVETHTVISNWGLQTLKHELGLNLKDIQQISHFTYNCKDMGALVSSGSFHTDGMVIAPCSMSTVGAIAHGTGSHLIHRAADVIIKEGRKLILLPREAPLSSIHLENLLKLSKLNVTIFPPVPAFYNYPKEISDIVTQTVHRVMDQLGIEAKDAIRWNGILNTSGSKDLSSNLEL